MPLQTITVIDTHTGGEPTRIVMAGGPDLGAPGLGARSLADRRRVFASKFDHYRSAIVNEPRGSDVMVGALICEPSDPTCAAGVIFFNNVGYLGMCGHGTIGVAVALAHAGRISPGSHRLETPVGVVGFDLKGANHVQFRNVPSYRFRNRVTVKVPGIGDVTGDIAWGGNWFFLLNDHGQQIEIGNTEWLIEYASRVRAVLSAQGITGDAGAAIDHIELLGPPRDPRNDSRNFVLCPGGAYDRSPCGTGTSAKLACLHTDGKLRPGQIWRQESIIGSVFEGSIELQGDKIIPVIRGSAHVTGTGTLILDPADPFCMGIPR
ncbi:MAG: proline racemase family protein [Burkholderiales bacterium]|nr:proline racemase family protein [Phycisphaerae bacterium]